MTKKDIRSQMLNMRNLLVQSEVEQRSSCIIEKLLAMEYYRDSSVIMTYVSIRNEVRTLDLIASALRDDKTLAVPLCITDTKDLKPCRITGLDDLVEGIFGIPEPVGSCEVVDIDKLDIVIVPGVAFDRKLNRLGHGAGYYDRFLARLGAKTLKIGLAFDFQLVDSLPVESHDIPLDILITETKTIHRQ